MAKSSITAKEVIELLRKRHPQPEWVFFDELRCGSGYAKASQKRIDAWALNCYPSKNHIKIAYEVKVYRSDFLNEMKTPKKRKSAMNLANQFYYIAPVGVIKLEEIPNDCGYIEIDDKQKLKVIKEAPIKEVKDPGWVFVSSLARRTAKSEGVDFGGISPEILRKLITVLRSSGSKALNGTETLLLEFLLKETIKLSDKEERQRRQLNKFIRNCQKKHKSYKTDFLYKYWEGLPKPVDMRTLKYEEIIELWKSNLDSSP